jgi:MFS-type transporter involved in bile tolerance (Atg22 family)
MVSSVDPYFSAVVSRNFCLVRRGFMSVSFHFFTPLLFKSSMVQLGWSMPSPAAWSLILAIGTTLGTVFSPLIGAVADQSR